MLIRLTLARLRSGGDHTEFVARLENQPDIADCLLDTGTLSPHARRVLELIAIFRQPVDLFDSRLTELSHRVIGRYDVLAGMAELQHRHLLTEPAAAVLHPLVRDRIRAELATDPARLRLWRLVATGWDACRATVPEDVSRANFEKVVSIPRQPIPE
jgi:hypothetical protein